MIYKDLIFIHIPKTGGSSIRSSLSKNYDLQYNATKQNLIKLGYSNLENFENYNFSVHDFKDHLPYQLIKKNNLEKNKFSFTFIRNPFSRMVSLYYECVNNPLIELDVNKDNSFEYFVNLVTKKSYWFTIPMIDYIGIDNIAKIDFIGRFENFENDILQLKKKIKISIKHHN
ncbi:sulfotransferase family protein, partial [Candidatus Pelagibacter sp.]|nr:sulfotransferase family protein [Candidatus Pelagibacter sp.]